MKYVTYSVTLKDAGATAIAHHLVRVVRVENGTEMPVFEYACLHPDGKPQALTFSVPEIAADGGRFVLRLLGPAHPERPGIINYMTELVLPRRNGGKIDFVMPTIAMDDLYDGKAQCGDDAPPTGPTDEAFADPPQNEGSREDFDPVILGPRLVYVSVTNAKGGHLNLEFSAQLVIHGAEWWTRCLPLDHSTIGRAFRVRRSDTALWVVLRKTVEGSLHSKVRLQLVDDHPVHVVFVLPEVGFP